MSSSSRSNNAGTPPRSEDVPASTREAEKPKSPGRYSMADEKDAVPPTRIDSTTRMPAVRPEMMNQPATRAAEAPAKPAPPRPPTAASPTQRSLQSPAAEAKQSVKTPNTDKSASSEVVSATQLARARELEDDAKVQAKPPVRPPSVPPPSRRISSLRPPSPSRPPEPKISEPPLTGHMLEEFDEGSIAFAFDALVSEGSPGGQPGTHTFDLQPVRELFAELAANHMRHVRDFMIDVKWGEVTRDWINICVPPVRTLRRAAQHLELPELGVALDKLGNELDTANAAGGTMLDADEKKRLLDTYGELVALLPQAFALDRDKTQREAVIVQALLLQVPDVRKVTIDKLHAAGLTSLTILFDANAHDIAHVAGIQHSLAVRIVDRVQAYRAELRSGSPQDARAAEREKLAGLHGQLKQQHAAYEEAQNGWGPEAKVRKREHFLAREETWLAISVLLARFGEIDRLQGIEKVPFSRRLEQLTEYLEEARDKYRSPEG